MMAYSELLIWGVSRKLMHGMTIDEANTVYGIPKSILKIWTQRIAAL